MVKVGPRIIPILAVALLPIFHLSAKDFADYQLGDKAEEDIIATSKLSVVDPEATQVMKDKEAMHVLAIVRYNTNAADDLEAQFREAFDTTRENFLNSVNRAFGHRKLSAEELTSFKFNSLAILFQKQNELFPFSTNRAALWASGDTDDGYVESLAPTLQQMMASPIRPEPISTDIKLGYTIRLMPLGDTNTVVTAQTVEQFGKTFSRSNFVALADVKREFQNFFPPEERNIAKYLATMVTPNCIVDEELTRQLRAKRTEGVWSVIDYKPGDVVAHRGQIIDGKIKAALDQLKEKAVMGQLQELQVKQQAAVGQLQQLVAAGETRGSESQAHIRWLVGSLAAVVLVLAAAIWRLARRKEPMSLLPMPASAGALEWQQRALTAEQRTEQLQNAARAGLMAHLSQWLSSMLTRRLISQRRLLLDTQSNAATEMAELEARLERVQAPLQVRLAAYEHRIAELEKELVLRGEENRELLKAKIEMMRKQLEAERGKNRLEFN